MSETVKKEEKDDTPSRVISINYKGTDYDLEFPNTGQMMDLAILKVQLSNGNYNRISNTTLLGDKLAQFSIDTISHLTILCPELLKTLNVASYSEMEMKDMTILINIYLEKILPWMNSWYHLLDKVGEK